MKCSSFLFLLLNIYTPVTLSIFKSLPETGEFLICSHFPLLSDCVSLLIGGHYVQKYGGSDCSYNSPKEFNFFLQLKSS